MHALIGYIREAFGGQVDGCVRSGDDGQIPVELPLYLPVEVVLVHVREKSIGGSASSRVGSAGRCHAIPEVDVVSSVQEVRIG